jgi:hypothetical protein
VVCGCGFGVLESAPRAGACEANIALAGKHARNLGASDIVESRTGAWWRPWWLFAWKAVCVIALLFLFASYFRSNKSHQNETTDAK